MQSSTTKINQNNSARRVVPFLFGLWRISPVLSWLMIITQILFAVLTGAIAPIFVSKLLAQITHGSANFSNSGGLLAAYAVTLILGDIVAVRLTIAMAYFAETKMQQVVLERVMESQTDKSLNFHANHMSGGIVSDATKLNGSIERFWDTLVFTAVPITATIVSVCIALSFVLWPYALVLAILSLIIAYLMIRSQNSIAPISRRVSEKSSGVTAYFADVIANMATVKAFAGEKLERETYHAKLSDWRQASIKEMRSVLMVTGSFGAMMVLMNSIAFAAAIIVTQHHVAAIGATYLVIGYTLNVVSQLWQVSQTTRNYIRIVGDAAPMIEMLDEPVELTDPLNPEDLRIKSGRVEFRKLTFKHDGSRQAIFKNLNLDIKDGEKVGLVGHSGSGKTTLTRLLLRFSDIEAGELLIDGQNINAITQADLRKQIAYVPQEPLLFHRSVRQNIAYGKDDAKFSEVVRAAKLAHAAEFIEDLPNGYDTLVGERGVKLSGGQRQRVAIARAMLKDAPILVLDEATSALDSESEKLIQDALWKLMEGRTAIVIAHRLSTIQKMDRILVLDDGKIVEQGSHKELLDKRGTYASLWAHQSGGFLED